jgi:hypothetical protein
MSQFNIRNLPALTDKQIDELCAQLGMTKTQLVIMAIDRLYQQEIKMTIETFQQHMILMDEYQAELNTRHTEEKANGCTCGHIRATATNAGHEGKVSFDWEQDTDPYCPIHGYEN